MTDLLTTGGMDETHKGAIGTDICPKRMQLIQRMVTVVGGTRAQTHVLTIATPWVTPLTLIRNRPGSVVLVPG